MTDEYLDIVDENDNFVRKDTRDNIYAKGLNHNVRVVNIFIFNKNGQLLLPKRSMNRKIFPGRFDFSCGEHVTAGENYDDAAIRGLKEELEIERETPTELFKLTPKDGVSCFMKVYMMNYDKEIKDYDKDGIDELYWCDLETIKKMIKKNENEFKRDFTVIFNRYIDIF